MEVKGLKQIEKRPKHATIAMAIAVYFVIYVICYLYMWNEFYAICFLITSVAILAMVTIGWIKKFFEDDYVLMGMQYVIAIRILFVSILSLR